MQNTNFSNKAKRMLGMNVDTWNSILISSLLVATISAAIGAIATYATIQLTKQESENAKKEFETYKLTVEGQVAEAKKEGIEAGQKAGDAILKAAELEKEAAFLRLELNREIQKHAQRLLTDEQKASMISELRGKLSEIAIVTQNDPEAQAFSFQIVGVFSDAGVKIYAPEALREDKWFAPAGLLMYTPAGSAQDQLKSDPLYLALKRVNLFGGTMGSPFLSGQPRIPGLPVIQGYQGRVLYIGQKAPF